MDSADKERLHEAKEELYNIIKSHEISPNVPVLVFANKQDLPGKHVHKTSLESWVIENSVYSKLSEIKLGNEP